MRGYGRIEAWASEWAYRRGQVLLRLSLGVIFVWFGLPKVLGVSAVDDLIGSVVPWAPTGVVVWVLGLVQVLTGVGFLFRPLLRVALLLFFLQMPGTMLPLVLLPGVCFETFPLAPTIEGQYVLKNLVLISAGIVVAGTLNSGRRDAQGRQPASSAVRTG